MDTTVNQWRIFCVIENSFIYGYLSGSVTNCTTCFNNNTHTVLSGSASILSTVSQTSTLISTQNSGVNGGNYRAIRENIICPANSITTFTKKFHYNVGILSFNYDASSNNIGDSFDLVVLPISPIGLLTTAVNSGDTIINIPATVMPYMIIGFQLILISASTGTSVETDEIISMNTTNNTITLNTAINTSFIIGDYIKFQCKRFQKYYINSVGHVENGNYLRTSVFQNFLQAELRYSNNNNVTTNFVFGVDILF